MFKYQDVAIAIAQDRQKQIMEWGRREALYRDIKEKPVGNRMKNEQLMMQPRVPLVVRVPLVALVLLTTVWATLVHGPNVNSEFAAQLAEMEVRHDGR